MKKEIKLISAFIEDLKFFEKYEYPAETFVNFLINRWKGQLELVKQNGGFYYSYENKQHTDLGNLKYEYIPKLKKPKTCDGCYLSKQKLYNNGNSTMEFRINECELGFYIEADLESKCGFKPTNECYKPITQKQYRKTVIFNKTNNDNNKNINK